MTRAKTFIVIIIAALIMTASSYPGYADAESVAHTGTVLETVNGGGYTYMNIEENGQRFWIAGPATSIGKGARVSFSEQLWMANFKSKALDRTFDRILFVDGIHEASAMPNPSAQGAKANAKAKTKVKAKAAATYTIKEIVYNKHDLEGKPVRVRGNVVKVSENIMGKTWVHIKDGTQGEGINKLIFTTDAESIAVGSAVIAQGRLALDRDFGYGYFYPIIVEDSTITIIPPETRK